MNYREMRKALKNEIHFIEYPKDVKGIIQKGESINYEFCNNCNTKLEKGEYINRTFVRIGQGHTFEQYCPFCYDKI